MPQRPNHSENVTPEQSFLPPAPELSQARKPSLMDSDKHTKTAPTTNSENYKTTNNTYYLIWKKNFKNSFFLLVELNLKSAKIQIITYFYFIMSVELIFWLLE